MKAAGSRPQVLCLIPARGGSKGLPGKNLRLLQGRPLIAHSIAQALASRRIHRTIVSTDDPAIADAARAFGAEVPFLRPESISGDLSTDLEAFQHALAWLRSEDGYEPEICVHLRPTHPIRRVDDIDTMVDCLDRHSEIESVRSVTRSPETPFKMWFRGADGLLTPVVTRAGLVDAHNLPRQLLPAVFLQNASIDVVRTRVITAQGSMTGTRIYGYVMDDSFDIDSEADLQRAAAHLDLVERAR